MSYSPGSPKNSSEIHVEFMEPVKLYAPFLLQDRGLDVKKDAFWLGENGYTRHSLLLLV